MQCVTPDPAFSSMLLMSPTKSRRHPGTRANLAVNIIQNTTTIILHRRRSSLQTDQGHVRHISESRSQRLNYTPPLHTSSSHTRPLTLRRTPHRVVPYCLEIHSPYSKISSTTVPYLLFQLITKKQGHVRHFALPYLHFTPLLSMFHLSPHEY